MFTGWQNLLLLGPTFLFSLCVHEYAHAWTAARKGDPTASQLGRLSLHPLAHADFVGTLALPAICLYYGFPFFGWAKPVPVDARYFKNPRRDFAVVAAAGPLANFGLAGIATALLAVIVRLPIESHWVDNVALFTVASIQVNLALGFFNLLPFPPLDGANVLQGFMTQKMAIRFGQLSRYSAALLLLLFFGGALRYLSLPISYVSRFLIRLATGL